jgi:hypothetical protein
MKIFKNMEELREGPEVIYKDCESVLKQISKDIDEPYEVLYKEPFENTFGGDVFLLESFKDQGEIQTTVENPETGQWRSLLETSSAFDICEWKGEDYLLVWYATNNAGGPSFWVPKSIVEESGFLRDSIDKTKQAWE